MTLQTKYANVRRYKIRYSKIILKLEIFIVFISFISQLLAAENIWLLPSLFLTSLICYIYFSKYSVIKQFPQSMILEFRSAPERLIWYDSEGESSFLIQDVDIRMTRWFVLLKHKNAPSLKSIVVLQDSFDGMNDYTSFRRHLLLNN